MTLRYLHKNSIYLNVKIYDLEMEYDHEILYLRYFTYYLSDFVKKSKCVKFEISTFSRGHNHI
jgi:hypothetical protein